ncbi:hypothetical protein RA13_13325 [Bacillus atrophaeus]|nr:hypothetical protein RA13_13325 [Bacillus atrophaeus]
MFNLAESSPWLKFLAYGKYIQGSFYMPKDSNVELSSFSYYEKLGDEYKRLEVMPITGENDCLGLSECF